MGGDGRGGDGRGGDGRREGGEGQGWEVREGKERARAATPSKYQQRNNRESKLEGKNNSPQEPWRVKSSYSSNQGYTPQHVTYHSAKNV